MKLFVLLNLILLKIIVSASKRYSQQVRKERWDPNSIKSQINELASRLGTNLTDSSLDQLSLSIFKRAKNTISLVEVLSLKKLIGDVASETSTLCEISQSLLGNTLKEITNSSQTLGDAESNIQTAGEGFLEQTQTINSSLYHQLKAIITVHEKMIHRVDRDTFLFVQNLLFQGTKSCEQRGIEHLQKFMIGSAAIKYKANLSDPKTRSSLEIEVEKFSSSLNEELIQLNLTNLHTFKSNVFTSVSDALDSLQANLFTLIDNAAENPNPDAPLSIALDQARSNLAKEVNSSLKKLEEKLRRLTRDVISRVLLRAQMDGAKVSELIKLSEAKIKENIKPLSKFIRELYKLRAN